MAGEAVEKTLHDAASKKQVVKLADLIQVDPHLLHGAPFACSRNLLHVATMYGQADLVEEVLVINPQLSRNLDSQNSSPLHIAAAKGNLEIAQKLLYKAPEMIWCCDGQGMNPVHVAAMNGKKQVLEELIREDYLPAMERLRDGQTVLHLCVKHRQLEAMKVLVDKLDQLHVAARDNDGYNILDSAVRSNQVDMIRYLVEDTNINKETMSSMSKKALDIWRRSPPHTSSTEIRKLLMKRSIAAPVLSLEERRQRSNALIVVAVLIATMAFQAAVSPPGGVWQDDTSSSRRAGHSVMATTHPKTYRVFLLMNTVSFVLSLVAILMLITGLPLSRFTVGVVISSAVASAELFIVVSYAASLIVITPHTETRSLSLVGGMAFILFSFYFGCFILVVARFVKGRMKPIT